jgi:hypothetical protein
MFRLVLRLHLLSQACPSWTLLFQLFSSGRALCSRLGIRGRRSKSPRCQGIAMSCRVRRFVERATPRPPESRGRQVHRAPRELPGGSQAAGGAAAPEPREPGTSSRQPRAAARTRLPHPRLEALRSAQAFGSRPWRPSLRGQLSQLFGTRSSGLVADSVDDWTTLDMCPKSGNHRLMHLWPDASSQAPGAS